MSKDSPDFSTKKTETQNRNILNSEKTTVPSHSEEIGRGHEFDHLEAAKVPDGNLKEKQSLFDGSPAVTSASDQTNSTVNTAQDKNVDIFVDAVMVWDVIKSIERLLNDENSEQCASISGKSPEMLHIMLLYPLMELRKRIDKLNNRRLLWCYPLLPMEAKTSLKDTIKIASWNPGKTRKTLVKAVLAILMNTLQMEVIMIQEVKKLDFCELYGKEKYNLICLPADPSTRTLKRGLFIMYRKEIQNSLSSPRGKVGRYMTQNNKITHVLDSNVEICSVDCPNLNTDAKVLLQSGKPRLINLYRGKANKSENNGFMEVLKLYIKENSLLIGDANFQSSLSYLTNQLQDMHKMINILPKQWDTHYERTKRNTQPDIVFSNIAQEHIIVHKPVDPHYLASRINTTNDITTDAFCKVYNEGRPSLEHHYVLFAELGDKINQGKNFHCCPAEYEISDKTEQASSSAQNAGAPPSQQIAGTSHSSSLTKEYHCSQIANNCTFYEKTIKDLNDKKDCSNLSDLVAELLKL